MTYVRSREMNVFHVHIGRGLTGPIVRLTPHRFEPILTGCCLHEDVVDIRVMFATSTKAVHCECYHSFVFNVWYV